jgi:drug/metabolite transporter (DMT)-like permease
MQTVYFIVFTVLGGVLAVFASAGWTSYTEHKLPDTHSLFRWLLAGTLTSGLAAYAWLFGAGGDPSALLAIMGDALDVKEVVKTLSSAVHSTAEVVEPVAATIVSAKETAAELTLGMPTFEEPSPVTL